MSDRTWCDNWHEVTLFGRYLLEEGFDADRLQEYYEAPWKWTTERDALLAADSAGKARPSLDTLDEIEAAESCES